MTQDENNRFVLGDVERWREGERSIRSEDTDHPLNPYKAVT